MSALAAAIAFSCDMWVTDLMKCLLSTGSLLALRFVENVRLWGMAITERDFSASASFCPCLLEAPESCLWLKSRLERSMCANAAYLSLLLGY